MKGKDGYIEHKEAKSNAALSRDFSRIAKQGKLSESAFSAWETQHLTKAKSTSGQATMQTPAMAKPATGGSPK